MNVARLAKFDTGQTLQNREVGQLSRTWPTLFVMFGGMPGLELVGLEDSTAPYRICKTSEPGQLSFCEFWFDDSQV